MRLEEQIIKFFQVSNQILNRLIPLIARQPGKAHAPLGEILVKLMRRLRRRHQNAALRQGGEYIDKLRRHLPEAMQDDQYRPWPARFRSVNGEINRMRDLQFIVAERHEISSRSLMLPCQIILRRK